MVAGLKELLPNVPSLDLAMRVLQSRIQRWRKGVGDSLLWSTSPTQWGGWSRRQVIILNDQKASPPLLPRHGWPLPTWCCCWRFKWRNSAGGGMLSPLLFCFDFSVPRNLVAPPTLQLQTRPTTRSWQRQGSSPRSQLSRISLLTIWNMTWLEGEISWI